MSQPQTDDRLVQCRPEAPGKLWLRYANGDQGCLEMERVLQLAMFKSIREPRVFMTGRLDAEGNCVIWPVAGIRLDAKILRLCASIQPGPVVRDPAFERFLLKCQSAPFGEEK